MDPNGHKPYSKITQKPPNGLDLTNPKLISSCAKNPEARRQNFTTINSNQQHPDPGEPRGEKLQCDSRPQRKKNGAISAKKMQV